MAPKEKDSAKGEAQFDRMARSRDNEEGRRPLMFGTDVGTPLKFGTEAMLVGHRNSADNGSHNADEALIGAAQE